MILWIANLTIMLTGLYLFRGAVSELGVYFQKRFLSLPEKGVGSIKMLIDSTLCSLSHGSFLQNQYGAVALLNSRSYSKHYAVLLLCLSILGMWTPLAGTLLLWRFEGFYFICAAVIFFLTDRWFGKGRPIFKLLLGIGLLLSGSTMLIQSHPQLTALLGENDFHFLLADGRFPAQLALLVGAFVLTAIVGLESWTLFVGIALLVSGTLSLNGAVALVIGELLAHVWVLAFRSRRLNQDVRQVSRSYALVSSGGLVLGFVLAGLLRTVFAWGYGFEGNDLENRVWQFLAMVCVIILSQMIPLMMWGHFAARKKLDEVQKGAYFPARWTRQGLLSKSFLTHIHVQLCARLASLQKQFELLDPVEKAKVPAAFQKQHESEIQMLTAWLAGQNDTDRQRS